MKTKWIEKEIFYDGSQLRTQWAYREWGVLGNSAVSWVGGCKVTPENMADGEDFLAGAEIRGSKMLHFVVEVFDCKLITAVALQRLFASIVREQILVLNPQTKLTRDGDDLYWQEGKLSISVAAQGVLSCMIHFALNISNEGTPVKTASLEDLEISPELLAESVLERFQKEFLSIMDATVKVFPLS